MELSGTRARKRYAVFAWAMLALNIPVILWGAYVRISFSGDGCGAHWPFCNGQVIPQHMAAPMAIEFTHRLMTSIDSIGAIVLCLWAFRSFPKGHVVRRYASLSLLFLFIEALLGAGLVLFRYVAHDQSAGRTVYLSAHLTNTMLLLGALTATAWLAQTNTERIRWKNMSGIFAAALLVTVLVSITGAIAALGDTLFPASSLAAGMREDFSSNSSLLLRLRLFHPLVAGCGALYLLWTAIKTLRAEEGSPVRKSGGRVVTLILFQILAGVVNIALLAPVPMQLLHLLLADVLWVAVLVMVLETANASERVHAPSIGGHPSTMLAR